MDGTLQERDGSTFESLGGVSHQSAKRRRESLWRSAGAFIIPVVILFFAFGLQGVFPFGKHHILTVDLYHQYAPFLANLREKLITGESLFFTWTAGLGINFFSLFAYYLASPVNILALIFPLEYLSELVLTLVLTKVGLMGYAFHSFIKKYYHRDGPLALGFSIAYALNGYVMAFFFNIMWLDGLYFLPFLALAMTKLIRENVYTPYIITLMLTLVSNFYSGFFVCLFMLFFYFIIVEREQLASFREEIRTLLQVVLSTIIGVGLSSFLVYPTYKAMQLSSAYGDKFPDKIEILEPTLDFLSRLIPIGSISIRRGMANIFVGTFVLLLFFVYLRSSKIRVKRKIMNISLLILLVFSLNVNVLNFIWHGMHFPNQLPFRNSFVLAFFILFMLYDSLPSLKEVSSGDLSTYTFGVLVVLMFLRKFDNERYPTISVLVACVFLVVYAALFSVLAKKDSGSLNVRISPRSKRQRKAIAAFLLLIVIIVEFVVNSTVSIENVENAEYFGKREGYSAGEEVDQLRRLIKDYQVKGQPDLTRMEILPDKSVNDAMLYMTNGFTIFSSTFPELPVKSIARFGSPNNGINSFQYFGSTPIMNSLLGIRYVINKTESKVADANYNVVYEQDELTVRENPYRLPLAFVGDDALLTEGFALQDIYNVVKAGNYPTNDENPFLVQEEFLNKLSGLQEKYFYEVPLEENEAERKQLTLNKEGEVYRIHRNGEQNGSIEFNLNVSEAGNHYLAWNVQGLSLREMKVFNGEKWNEVVGRKNATVSELGYLDAGTSLRIFVDFKGERNLNKNGTLKISAVRLNEEAFVRSIDALKLGKSEILEHDARSFTLKATGHDNSMLFISTPCDPGWQCYVDGEKQAIQVIDGAFLGIPLRRGDHIVKFVFTPDGFNLGSTITLASLAVTIILFILDLYYLRRAKFQRKEAMGQRDWEQNNSKVSQSVLRGWPQPLPNEIAANQPDKQEGEDHAKKR